MTEKTKLITPQWAKKLYKKIVTITHPDVTSSIPSSFLIKKFTNQYMIATTSYNEADYHNLLMVGYDLGLSIEDEIVEKSIVPEVESLNKKISTSKLNPGYQWYHTPDNLKEKFLENFLRHVGFDFTKKKVKEVIIKCRKNKRKVGQRPNNYIKNRRR